MLHSERRCPPSQLCKTRNLPKRPYSATPSGAKRMYSPSPEYESVLPTASRMIGASVADVARTGVATRTPVNVDAPRAGSLVSKIVPQVPHG